MDAISVIPDGSFSAFLVLQYLVRNPLCYIFSVKITGVISVFFLDRSFGMEQMFWTGLNILQGLESVLGRLGLMVILFCKL